MIFFLRPSPDIKMWFSTTLCFSEETGLRGKTACFLSGLGAQEVKQIFMSGPHLNSLPEGTDRDISRFCSCICNNSCNQRKKMLEKSSNCSNINRGVHAAFGAHRSNTAIFGFRRPAPIYPSAYESKLSNMFHGSYVLNWGCLFPSCSYQVP